MGYKARIRNNLRPHVVRVLVKHGILGWYVTQIYDQYIGIYICDDYRKAQWDKVVKKLLKKWPMGLLLPTEMRDEIQIERREGKNKIVINWVEEEQKEGITRTYYI
jgi:hypothetical protein